MALMGRILISTFHLQLLIRRMGHRGDGAKNPRRGKATKPTMGPN